MDIQSLQFVDVRFWLYFLYFFIALFLAFYIPGTFFLKKQTLSQTTHFILATVIGMVFWGLQGMVFGYLHLRVLSYFYLLFFFLVWIRNQKVSFKSHKLFSFSQLRIDYLLFIIVIIGSLVQILGVWFIGYFTQNGLEFCCFWPDSMYYIGLTNQLVESFPPTEPGMSGVIVKNYHYLSNLIIAELIRVFHLPLLQTHYQYFAVFISVFYGLSVVAFAKVVGAPKAFARWIVFFLYFSGDIIFVILYFLGKGFDFTLTLSENATSIWFSPSRMFAIISIFITLALFYLWIKKKDMRTGFIFAILAGSIISLKVYLGIFFLAGCGVIGLYFLIQRRFRMVVPLVLILLVSILLYFPINNSAGGLFFVGLWRFENFAVTPHFNLIRLELARQFYVADHNTPRLIMIEGIFILLYIVSLFGVFLLSFVQTKKSLAVLPKEIHILLLSGFATSLFLGFFFLQHTGGANTIQFLFIVYIIGSIYTALFCTHFIKKIKGVVQVIVICIIVLLAGGRVVRETLANVSDLIDRTGYYVVSNDELDALSYIRHNTEKNAIIAVYPDIAKSDACYYNSFLSNHAIFLCGSGILTDHGQSPSMRVQDTETIYFRQEAGVIKDAIIRNSITYLYMPTEKHIQDTEFESHFLKVYENKTVKLYKIDYKRI